MCKWDNLLETATSIPEYGCKNHSPWVGPEVLQYSTFIKIAIIILIFSLSASKTEQFRQVKSIRKHAHFCEGNQTAL